MADTVVRSALSAGLIDLYEETYRIHANAADTGVCPIDGEADCERGQLAWEKLVLAGAVPEQTGSDVAATESDGTVPDETSP